MTDNTCIGARPTDQALVSDQSASRLAPSGFDPSRKAWLIWATEGEYSDRSEWPVAVVFSQVEGETRTVRIGQLWRHLHSEYKRRQDELDDAGDWRGRSLLLTDEGREYVALSGDDEPYFSGSYADERTYTCSPVPVIMSTRDSDGSPKGGDGEAGSVHDSADPKGIAHTHPESH